MCSTDNLLTTLGNPTLKKTQALIRPVRIPMEWKSTPRTMTVQCHERMGRKLQEAVVKIGHNLGEWPKDIQTLNVRLIAGTECWSAHSWAMAFDVWGESELTDPKTGRGLMSREWSLCMEEEGFTWGGRWKKKDPHHFELRLEH